MRKIQLKNKTIASLFFLAIFVLIITLDACKKQPHEITTVEKTALEHAYACEDVLGPLPKFSCSDAIEVPTTKDGVPVTSFPVSEEGGVGSLNPNDCDHPWAFGLACQPGNKVGRYQGLNTDGTENPDVVFITFCRDGGLGVIGYKFSTGETCFFSIVDGSDSNNPPKPGEDGYNNAWMTPKIVAADKCVNCHMASPFIHSPAIDQLRNPMDTSELLVPITGNEPYIVIGTEFQQPFTTNIQNFVPLVIDLSVPNILKIILWTNWLCHHLFKMLQTLIIVPFQMKTDKR